MDATTTLKTRTKYIPKSNVLGMRLTAATNESPNEKVVISNITTAI